MTGPGEDADRPAVQPPAFRLDMPLAASRPRKRSFSIRGHKTSISLEAAFWDALVEIARARGLPLAQLIAAIDAERGPSGLSGAVRIFILDHYRRAASVSPT